MQNKLLSRGAALTALTWAIASSAFAQDTSSSMRGAVTDDAGSPIAGADVTVTHVPSGTRSQVTTDAAGNFDLRGLRVGGPYLVTFSAADYNGETVENVYLNLGEVYRLTADLAPGEEEIIVVGAAPPRQFAPGATRFSSDDINSIAAVRRDVRDIARRDPRVTLDVTNQNQAAPQIAGNNNRFNTLTIDGVAFDDDFGLNASGLPTQRSPITLEAIEQLTLSTTPFDVQSGQFMGGAINIVTRSGGNDFHGSLSYQYGDSQSLAGTRIPNLSLGGVERDTGVDFTNRTWVATLSGPIIQDRLFFFLSYENFEGDFANLLGPIDDDAGDPIFFQTAGTGGFLAGSPPLGVADNEVTQAVNILRNPAIYNYNTLGPASVFDESDEKYLVRFDWNITDDHRAVLSLTRALTVDPRTGSSGNHSSGSRTLSMLDNFYATNEEVSTAAFILYSDWSDQLSTEFAVSWRQKLNDQAPFGGVETGQFDICAASDVTANPARTCASTDGRIFAGSDGARHANLLETSGYNVRLSAQYAIGNHRLLAGYELDRQDVYNIFVFNAEGAWVFRSLEALAARDAFSVSFTAPCFPGAGGLPDASTCTDQESAAAADWGYNVHTFYLQDTWDITDSLTVVGGLRYDYYTADGEIFTNPGFVTRNGYSNAQTIDGEGLLSPRLGFEWRPDDALRVYGGVGLFGGGSPNVWISNNYQNDGVRLLSIFLSRSNIGANVAAANALNNADIVDESQLLDFVRDPANASFVAGATDVNALSPDFEVPSTWRAVLGLEARVEPFEGHTLTGRMEVMRSQVENALAYVNPRLQRIGTFADGRPLYNNAVTGRDLVLTNTGEGESTVVTLGLNYELGEAWAFDLGYAHQEAYEVNPLTSSTASSNWNQRAVFDPNAFELSRSNYETEHRITIGATWRERLIGDLETMVSLFGERRTGVPFSYTFNDFRNSTVGSNVMAPGFNARGLIYVPTGPSDPNVTYAAFGSQTALQAQQLMEQIINSTELANHRGTYAPRNIGTSPDVTTFDLRFSQELPGFFNGHRSILFVDIENVGNLINPDWGLIQYPTFPRTAVIADVERGPVNGSGEYTYRYSNVRPVTYDQCPEINNCRGAGYWQIQVGLRYQF